MILLTSATTLLCCVLLAVTLGSSGLRRWRGGPPGCACRCSPRPRVAGFSRPRRPARGGGGGRRRGPALDGPKSVRETDSGDRPGPQHHHRITDRFGGLLVVCCGWLCDPTRDQRWLAVALAMTLAGAVCCTHAGTKTAPTPRSWRSVPSRLCGGSREVRLAVTVHQRFCVCRAGPGSGGGLVLAAGSQYDLQPCVQADRGVGRLCAVLRFISAGVLADGGLRRNPVPGMSAPSLRSVSAVSAAAGLVASRRYVGHRPPQPSNRR